MLVTMVTFCFVFFFTFPLFLTYYCKYLLHGLISVRCINCAILSIQEKLQNKALHMCCMQ